MRAKFSSRLFVPVLRPDVHLRATLGSAEIAAWIFELYQFQNVSFCFNRLQPSSAELLIFPQLSSRLVCFTVLLCVSLPLSVASLSLLSCSTRVSLFNPFTSHLLSPRLSSCSWYSLACLISRRLDGSVLLLQPRVPVPTSRRRHRHYSRRSCSILQRSVFFSLSQIYLCLLRPHPLFRRLADRHTHTHMHTRRVRVHPDS